MAEQLKVCLDKFLPKHLRAEAELRAIEENPANAPQPGAERLEIAVLKGKLWQLGRVLRVCFLDGSPALQEKVTAKAKEWEQYVNIHLDFGNNPGAEIRISFSPDGSWSYMGTDAFLAPADEQTMNFGWLDEFSSDDEISRVVLHEFGHALGAIHEHQHPELAFEWDEAAVLAYYMGPPNNWSEEEVRFNVLDRYSAEVTQYSKFDPESIMLYPIPNKFTIGDYEVPWRNTVLSDLDKEFMGTVYPCDESAGGC